MVDAAAQLGSLIAFGVGVHFEGLRALEAVDLRLARGEILGLIGPNGAGKTTLVNVLSGYQRPSEGGVRLDGLGTAGWQPHHFARNGLGRTFQAARLFPEMTVLENVEMPGVGLGLSRRQARARAEALLSDLGIIHRATVPAQALTYGEERLVGLARALALTPKFLLLDEPAAGLSPHEAQELMQRIAAVRERFGCGVLLIEHNMQVIMRLCDRVQVLARGKTIAVGTPTDVQASTEVRQAYLGASGDAGIAIAGKAAAAQAGQALLAIENLVVDYGSARALAGVSLSVCKGEFVAVIGPNGAGKSTLLATITGLVKPKSGTIQYEGRRLGAEPPARRVRDGIALVPEGRRILSNLTVEENLRVGETVRRGDPEAARRFEHVLATFPVLRSRLKGYAGRLSGGEQQQLAIARALLSGPKLLLLDEPSLGLAPLMIEQVYETLVKLNEDGLTILLMEQNANRALLAGDRAYVLRHGVVELEGPTATLRTDPAFDQAYFGFDAREGIATH
ncbi:ATP-binding cassette domain-containing protein [Vineibacter terrae]|uniref:ATP-binding cassette domain-containing protein n=1 Tax=Vineibacter terrae TaxID=2586908 RepID=UPI002E370725|nr:ATP-binding cassette domain-containing protein [Vineibacter terrae]HEX2884998.1 ATP-binding cassette domain-containing protein [Vineibacter terrae]